MKFMQKSTLHAYIVRDWILIFSINYKRLKASGADMGFAKALAPLWSKLPDEIRVKQAQDAQQGNQSPDMEMIMQDRHVYFPLDKKPAPKLDAWFM